MEDKSKNQLSVGNLFFISHKTVYYIKLSYIRMHYAIIQS